MVVTTMEVARGELRAVSYPVRDLLSRRKEGGSEGLVRLITTVVAPKTWVAFGGAGTIEYYPGTGNLVITQTGDVHEQVADLLNALRREGEVNKND